MELSNKLLALLKQSGMSQEVLAEKLNVSRQAISRWETGSAQPDANNILQISELFSVTTDYLLNDDYERDNAFPKVKEVKDDSSKQIFIYLVTLEVMVLILQLTCVFLLQNIFFAGLSFILFVAVIGMSFYPRPYYMIILECVILVVYITTSLLVDLAIEKDYLHTRVQSEIKSDK